MTDSSPPLAIQITRIHNGSDISASSLSVSLLADDQTSFLDASERIQDVEKCETTQTLKEEKRSSWSFQFLVWMIVNTLATIGIVFTNKAIFVDPALRLSQSAFAAFHFAVTGGTLYVASRPWIGMFKPVKARFTKMLPLALAMCLNVILPNFSLAFSSIAFYQIVRVLLTPLVGLINFLFYGSSIPRKAVYAMIPICVGVAMVSYYDTQPLNKSRIKMETLTATTSFTGVCFAFAGILASSVYTVWIGAYQKKLKMNSMQLLFNQAPWSAFLLLFVIRFTDQPPYWENVPQNRWVMILLSGVLASLINISQFFIVAGAGPVSSTVVGHVKTCSIVALGWTTSGRKVNDKGVMGILLAMSGIIAYSIIMYRHRQKQQECTPVVRRDVGCQERSEKELKY